ncbi:MAG: hypothetical protein KDA81_18100, partial [Planctomycetaceae bacterium]|nr:hypothetical protein [Planctomycetaceae bacterium]
MYGQRSYRKFLRSTREILRIVYRVLVSPIVLLSRAFSWLVEVIETWWKERRLVNLLWGLPAVVLGGVTVYFALGHEADSRFVRAARYARRGDDLLKSGEYQTASLLLGRAVSLNPADNAAAFSLSKACSGAGDGSRALAILDRLAPPNGIGDPDAHLWRAKTILSRSNIGESDLQAAESHLLNALKVRTSDSEAN